MKPGRKDIFASTVLALALWVAPGLRADVTIRYQSEFKPSAAFGPIMEPFMKTVQAGFATSARMKGNKAYTTAGNWIEIFDFVKQEVTLIDPAHKTFAALPASQLADRMAGALPQPAPAQMQAAQQAMASIKTNVDSKMTGKTAEIQGVQAEEREVTVTMDMPMPMPAGMNQSGPSLRLVMHIWTAKKEEALRVPAIRELTGYQAWQRYILNPAGMLEKFAGKMPGMSNTIGPMFDEIYKNPSVILRMHMEMYMPFMAVVAKQMAGQGQAAPVIDPDAPLMEMNQEVAELSSAPVDPSLFEIPTDYAAVPADDMIRNILQAQRAAAAIAPKADAPK
jgi:hypothetical protein